MQRRIRLFFSAINELIEKATGKIEDDNNHLPKLKTRTEEILEVFEKQSEIEPAKTLELPEKLATGKIETD